MPKPGETEWINRRIIAVLKARDVILPYTAENAINNFALVKVASAIDHDLWHQPWVRQLMREPTEVLARVESQVEGDPAFGYHQRRLAFERIGRGALYLCALGSPTLQGPEEALDFLEELRHQSELEAIGSTSYKLAGQEAFAFDFEEASTYWRLASRFDDYTHIVRYAARILETI